MTLYRVSSGSQIISNLLFAARNGKKVTVFVEIKARFSENINIINLVDLYLEHTRIMVFHNGGRKKVFTGSADWMKRNLSRRIEVVFPILDADIRKNILTILDYQLCDDTKAKIIVPELHNEYRKTESNKKINAQLATYQFINDLEI